MKRNILYLFLTIGVLTGCQGSGRKDTYQENTTYPSNLDDKYPAPTYQNTQQSPTIQQDYTANSVTPNDAYQEGYDNGYEQGKEDGRRGLSHGSRYDDACDYYDYFETRYEEGYEEGYDDGYSEGSNKFEEEKDEDSERDE
jgi:lipoprotein